MSSKHLLHGAVQSTILRSSTMAEKERPKERTIEERATCTSSRQPASQPARHACEELRSVRKFSMKNDTLQVPLFLASGAFPLADWLLFS